MTGAPLQLLRETRRRLAAPAAEELPFRGLLYRGLESSIGVVATILLTSVVFGLLHQGFGWERLIATGCVGLLFGWVRWHTGNTSICIVAHALMNSIGAAALTMQALFR